VVEPGDIIEIRGGGFVEGPTTVTFDGAFDPVGLVEGVDRVVVLEGTATSGGQIQVPVTGTTMGLLAAEPTVFRGTVSASFPDTLLEGATSIGAKSAPLELELRPAGGGVAAAARRTREADEILRLLGMSVESAAGQLELVISGVVPGGPADRHGMAPGDRILSVNGVPMTSANDIAGLELSEPHVFQFATPGGAVQSARIRAAPLDPLEMDEFVAIVLTALSLGVFLAFAWPRRRSRGATEPSRSGTLMSVVGFAVVSIPILTLPALAILTRADVGAALALLGISTASVVLATLHGGMPNRPISMLARLLVVPILLVLAGAFGSTFGLWNVVLSQSTGPWGWHAWSNPFAILAVLAAVSLVWQPISTQEGTFALAAIAGWSAAVTASMVITAWTLGGWLLPTIDPGRAPGGALSLLLGVAVFAAKTWLVLLGARWFAGAGAVDRRTGRARAGSLLLKAGLLVVSAAGAMAWNWAGLPEDLCAAGRVLSGGFSIALATAFVTSKVAGLLRPRDPLRPECHAAPGTRS